MISRLFFSFLKIGAVSFGGGYAVIAMIQQEILEKYGVIDSGQFIDMVAISEMTPGPLAINSSTFVGFKAAGIAGAFTATVAVVLIPVILSLLLASFYRGGSGGIISRLLYGIRPCVVPVILFAVIKLFPMSINDIYGALIAAAMAAIYHFKKISPILMIIIGGFLGYIVYGIGIPYFA